MKAISLLAVALLVSGCATQRMGLKDLSSMQPDCANKEAQIKFLESQMTTQGDRMMARLGMNSITELIAYYRGEKSQERSMVDREYDATARLLIWQLRSQCPNNRQYVSTK